jgi:hypothetical protein
MREAKEVGVVKCEEQGSPIKLEASFHPPGEDEATDEPSELQDMRGEGEEVDLLGWQFIRGIICPSVG